MATPDHAADRLRLYTELIPHHALGEIACDERFRSEEWPRTAYHPNRPDLVAVLDDLDGYGEEIHRLRNHNDATCEAVAERDRLREELAQARATIRRLNYRCQQNESKIAALVRLVGNWRLSEKGTYVPLRNLTNIAKLAGRTIEDDRYELHYQRVEGLEDAAFRAARILLRATTGRARSSALLATLPAEAPE